MVHVSFDRINTKLKNLHVVAMGSFFDGIYGISGIKGFACRAMGQTTFLDRINRIYRIVKKIEKHNRKPLLSKQSLRNSPKF